MSDEQRKAKDEAGPQEIGRYVGITEPTGGEGDTEGHVVKCKNCGEFHAVAEDDMGVVSGIKCP